jgi:chromosome segregation ATPase
MDLTLILELVGGGAVVVLGLLWLTGNLGRARDIVQTNTDAALDRLQTPAQKAQAEVKKMEMAIGDLEKLFGQEEDEVVRLQTELEMQEGTLRRFNGEKDVLVQSLQATPVANPGNTAAITKAAGKVADKETEIGAQEKLCKDISESLATAEAALQSSAAIIKQRKNELPAARADAIVTAVFERQNAVLKKSEEIKAAASAGKGHADNIKRLRLEAENKAKRHTPDEAEQRTASYLADAHAQDVLKRYLPAHAQAEPAPAPTAPVTPSPVAAPTDERK